MVAYLKDGEVSYKADQKIPVVRKYDVIVAGGGSGGCGAAVAAGRMGAKTLLIERASYLGGTSTGGMMAVMWAPYDSYSGYCKEAVDEMVAMGAAQTGPIVPFDPSILKQVHLRNVLKAGVDLLFYTYIVDAIVENGAIKGVIVENKSGRQAILADQVVDATADGDVAAFAGASFQMGRSDGAMRPVTILFRMGNVDTDELLQYANSNPDQFIKDTHVNFVVPEEGKLRLAGFFDLVKAAREKKELDKDCHYLRIETVDFDKKIALINTVRVYGVDGTNAWDVTRGEIESRKQMETLITFMKAKVPGFGKSFLIDTSDMLGVRETRHVHGLYTLNYDDVLKERQFDDTVGINCTHLPHGKEMHSPDANEGGETDIANRVDDWPRLCHEIPFRILVAKDVDNLYVAGRHMSATHEADRVTRNIPPCILVGQAAGTAAALCSKMKITPKQLDIRTLQRELLANDVVLGHPIPGVAKRVPAGQATPA
jgi:hypothetical protein